uniref:Thioredoxin reductase n=1 Tax=candidate division WOR-3 bacterium TaxID=2052148 RepID=A0A7C6A8L8_UNCW3
MTLNFRQVETKSQLVNYDVVVIGGGPAGLTAGIYSRRAGLKTILLEKTALGGQASLTPLIENYPGFPEGISGDKLIEKMVEQAKKFGVTIAIEEVEKIEQAPSSLLIKTKNQAYQTKAAIIATGSRPKELGVSGEKKLIGRGISYCAVCDGPLFKDRIVGVVGGGDSALTEAIYLSKFTQKVYLIHRRDQFRAARSIKDKVFAIKNIEVILNALVKRIEGEKRVEGIVIANQNTNQETELKLDGLFIYVGNIPNTDFVKGLINLDEEGYIVTDENLMTNVFKIFAAGDVRKKPLRQIATAVGDGALAAIMVEKNL